MDGMKYGLFINGIIEEHENAELITKYFCKEET